jgi:alpha-beta hydrolase superfamily lysophospholipase
MEDIESVEQFIVDELPIISPIIKTDDIYIIGHSKGGVSALLYCTQYDTKIYVLGQVRLIFTVRGIQKLEQWRADGVQYIKNARTK